jgi:hypothetical protein
MRLAAAVLAALASVAAVACKPRVIIDGDAPTAEQIADEQRRAAAGEKVGEGWRAPQIAVDARGLTYNGTVLVPPGDLPTSFARVERLEQRLKGDRDHWKQVYPERSFPPDAEVTFGPDVPSVVAASVLATLPSVGYGPRQRVRAGELSSELRHYVPGVGGAPPSGGVWGVQPTPEGARAWFVGDGRCTSARRPRNVASLVEAASLIADACPEAAACPKALFVGTRAGQTARDLLEQTGALLASPAFRGGEGAVTFSETHFAEGNLPCLPPPAAAAPAGGASAGAAKGAKGEKPPKGPVVRYGAANTGGAIEPAAVEAAVRGALGALGACYDEGLTRNPTLVGRVAARLVVTARGEVTRVTNASSDLPDSATIVCVLDALGGLTFPKPAGGALAFEQPFAFTP